MAADGIENEATRAFHEEDIYNPIDPEDLRRWLAEAGFCDVAIDVYDLGWLIRPPPDRAFRGPTLFLRLTAPSAGRGPAHR